MALSIEITKGSRGVIPISCLSSVVVQGRIISACRARAFQHHSLTMTVGVFPGFSQSSNILVVMKRVTSGPIDHINIWVSVFATIIIKFLTKFSNISLTRATGMKSVMNFPLRQWSIWHFENIVAEVICNSMAVTTPPPGLPVTKHCSQSSYCEGCSPCCCRVNDQLTVSIVRFLAISRVKAMISSSTVPLYQRPTQGFGNAIFLTKQIGLKFFKTYSVFLRNSHRANPQ